MWRRVVAAEHESRRVPHDPDLGPSRLRSRVDRRLALGESGREQTATSGAGRRSPRTPLDPGSVRPARRRSGRIAHGERGPVGGILRAGCLASSAARAAPGRRTRLTGVRDSRFGTARLFEAMCDPGTPLRSVYCLRRWARLSSAVLRQSPSFRRDAISRGQSRVPENPRGSKTSSVEEDPPGTIPGTRRPIGRGALHVA